MSDWGRATEEQKRIRRALLKYADDPAMLPLVRDVLDALEIPGAVLGDAEIEHCPGCKGPHKPLRIRIV